VYQTSYLRAAACQGNKLTTTPAEAVSYGYCYICAVINRHLRQILP